MDKFEEEANVYRIEERGKVMGRLMRIGKQWLALRREIDPDDAVRRRVKAFPTLEDAMAWIKG